MDGSSLWYVITLLCLVNISIAIVEMFLIFHVASHKHMCNGKGVGGDWSSVSRDMKYLVCRMTSQNQVIEGSFKFMSESYSRYVSNLSSLGSIGIVLVEIGF